MIENKPQEISLKKEGELYAINVKNCHQIAKIENGIKFTENPKLLFSWCITFLLFSHSGHSEIGDNCYKMKVFRTEGSLEFNHHLEL